MPDPAITEQHLANLNELSEIGMVLARRLRDLPPLKGQDTARDLDIITRVVRRCILLYHLIATDRLPTPRPAPEPKLEPIAPATDRLPAADLRTRLDPIDRLDDVSGPFHSVVASIVTDIQAVLATCHPPAGQAERIQEIARRKIPPPDRHEADTPDLN